MATKEVPRAAPGPTRGSYVEVKCGKFLERLTKNRLYRTYTREYKTGQHDENVKHSLKTGPHVREVQKSPKC